MTIVPPVPADLAALRGPAPSVAVIGAGAAGLMAAVAAAAAGARVVLIERTADGGRKILISGGGRCNVLPSALAPERFVSDAPAHVVRRLLKAWPLGEQRAFFEGEVGIPLALEAESGKLFPRSNRARDVRDSLVALARSRGVRLDFGTLVSDLAPSGAGWVIDTTRGPVSVDRVVVATGGLSVPATGSDGAGLRLMAALGHRVIPAYPALTPLTADPAPHAGLAGLTVTVRLRARCRDRSAESTGGFLFTHRGYSGPAVLDVSHIATRSAPPFESAPSSSPAGTVGALAAAATIRVQWTLLDASAWTAEFGAAPGLVSSVVGRHLPARLALQLMAEAGVPATRRASALRRTERLALVAHLTAYELPWTGHEGYKKAEVTGGGVALDDVDPHTLESRRRQGLFLCGEILDAFGPIGGHNFAWAWATGRAAGLGAARRAAA